MLARHAGIDEETGQLAGDEDGGPRRLVISSDFYTVYESAGKKADGLVNLYCWAHLRRHVVRAGDANPAQLKYWTDAWLGRIRDLYPPMTSSWPPGRRPRRPPRGTSGRRREAGEGVRRLGRRDHGDRRDPEEADGRPRACRNPRRRRSPPLDREWDGLTAHRDYPMVSLDNNAAESDDPRPGRDQEERPRLP